MSRSTVVAVALCLTLAGARAGAQEGDAATEQAYTRIEMKIVEIRNTPPDQKNKVYQELFASCGSFIDQHARRASQAQLLKVGKLWFMLADRLQAPEPQVRAKITALRALPKLPAELDTELKGREAVLSLRAGSAAPPWRATDVKDGAQVGSETFSGKLVLMDFWASWCDPCKEFMETKLKPLHEKYGQDQRLVMLGLGAPLNGDTTEAQKKFVEEKGYAWRMVFDATGHIGRSYNVRGIPHLVLVDVDGNILVMGPSFQVWPQVERMLTERLGAGGAAPQGPAGPGR